MKETSPNRLKTQWEKEKLLVTSNFSYSHSVFKRLVSQGRQKVSLCGNGLKKLKTEIYLVYQPKLYPFPNRQILDSSKNKEFADDNFKFDENGRKFFKWVENTVGQGEIARYEQFLLFR